MRGLISASVLSAVILAASACGGGSAKPTPTPRTLNGSVALSSQCKTSCSDPANLSPDASWQVGKPCAGSGSYADMKAGAPVVVKNGSGAVIANGQLTQGVGAGTAYVEPDHRPYTATCTFLFAIDNVPDSEYYTIEIHRGASTFSRSDLQLKHWTVSMNTGGN